MAVNSCSIIPRVLNKEYKFQDSDLFTDLYRTLKLKRDVALGVYDFVLSDKFTKQVGEVVVDNLNEPLLNQDESGYHFYTMNGKKVLLSDVIKASEKRVNKESDLKYNRIINLVDEQKSKLEARKKVFENLKGANVGFSPRQDKINDIAKLIDYIRKGQDTEDYFETFVHIIKNAKEELSGMSNYLDQSHDYDLTFSTNIAQFSNYIDSYKGLVVPDLAFEAEFLEKEISQISSLLNKLEIQIDEARSNFVIDKVKNFSRNEKLVGDIDQLEGLMKEGYDISAATLYTMDIAGSGDTLLALVDSIYKEKRDEHREVFEAFSERLNQMGNVLNKATGTSDCSFMLRKDEKGNPTGKYIQRVGEEYTAKLKELNDALKDSEGERLQYIPIDDIDEASKADLDFNKDLQAKKKKLSDFLRAEKFDFKKGEVQEGENHKYSEEFLEQRRIHETLLVDKKKGTTTWVKADGITDEQYKKFLKDYYQEEKEVYVAVKDKNETTGQWEHLGRVELRKMRLPLNDFVEVKNQWNDPQYNSIMSDNTTQGKARKEFYEFYTTEWPRFLSYLPADVRHRMEGRIPVQRKRMLDAMSSNGGGFFNMIARQFRNFITPTAVVKSRLLDENGFPVNDIPLFFTGNLQAEEEIARLEKEIATIIPSPSTKKQLDKLNKQLTMEKSKVSSVEFETNLIDSMRSFASMAENYRLMKEAESALLVVKHVVENKRYFKTDWKENIKLGKGSETPEFIEGKKSNTHKRLETWMDMIFYKTTEVDGSTGAVIAKKLLSYNSFRGIGLNPFSGANNYIMARVNQSIEKSGEQYYSKAAYNKASTIVTTELILTKLKEYGQYKANKDKYKVSKPLSKSSALIKELNVIAKQASVDGRDDDSFLDFVFMFQEAGEFEAQSRSALAMVLDQMVGDEEGNEVPLYDVIKFDPNTGKTNLKELLSAKEIRQLSNTIREVNKTIHGNYDEKVALQQHWIGDFVMQFHKFIPRATKARFGKRYFDEATGVEIEGRYRTVWKFLGDLRTFNGKFTMLWNTLDNLEKANLKKTAAEIKFFMYSLALYILAKGVAAGLDDEDEQMKKAINFLAFQQSRQMNELRTFVPVFGIDQQYDLLKSPLAVATTLNKGAEMIADLFNIPYYYATEGEGVFGLTAEDPFYDRGIHKDENKFIKNAKDMIPGLKTINQWAQFEQTNKFFVR